MPDFWGLVERLGVPLAFAVVAVWALVNEKIVPGKRLENHDTACELRMKELRDDFEDRLREQREEYEKRLQMQGRDRDYYRQLTFSLLPHLDKVAAGLDRAINKREGES